jgi:type IV secretory pathway VirB10-like protein
LRPALSIYGQAYSLTKEKEKPIFKQHILGTDWFRITTSEGNIFYFHKITKQSVWSAPDELKTVVTQDEGALTLHSSNQSTDAKRKADEPVSIDEIVLKKARLDDGTQDEESSDSDEEDWQRDAAEQLAAEAEEQQKRKEGGEKEETDPETQGIFGTKEFVMPQEISISIEEGRALFKVCSVMSVLFDYF